MKKVKMALLYVSMAGLIVAFAGFGTYAWFTSQTTAEGTMKAGTLELNNGGDIEASIFSGEGLTPSQLEYGNWLTISNSGNLDMFLKATYHHSVDQASLEEYEVGYMAMKYTEKPDGDVQEQAEIELANLFNDPTNERQQSATYPDDVEVTGGMLGDEEKSAVLANDGEASEIEIGEGEDGDSFWSLEEDQYIDIMFGLKLEAGAGNEYQGATYEAGFTVEGKQTDDGAEYSEE